MPIMESCMRRITEEFNKRANFNWDLPFKYEFNKLLKKLDPEEKILLKKYFCTLEWNVGSTKLLACLQTCRVISATEYLLIQEDDEHIQLVLNDFLETQFELLANFVNSCYYDLINSTKITVILEECFRQLFLDLKANPESAPVNYIAELRKLQLEEEVLQMLRQMHVNVLMQEDKSGLENAFGSLLIWQKNDANDTFFYKLLCELVNSDLPMLKYILKKSLEPEFQGWKYFTVLLQICMDNCTSFATGEIKTHLKELFKLFLREKDEKFFYIMLFTARVIYTVKNSNSEMYQQWFKTTIGEMNYRVNPQEFKFIMSVLSQSLAIERDTSFLEIQTNTAIPAPPLCNQLVLNYKKHCKQKLSSLKNENISDSFNMEDSIVID